MKQPSEFSPDELAVIRRRLRGKRLVSRANWVARQGAYVVACVVGFVAAIRYLDGLAQTVAVLVVAILAGGIFEVLIDWRYGNYRAEWELANAPDADVQDSRPPSG